MIDWWFWGVTLSLLAIAEVLSAFVRGLAKHDAPWVELILGSRLGADIAAAATLWLLGLAIYYRASFMEWFVCNLQLGQMPGADLEGCRAASSEAIGWSEHLSTTIGINPIIWATAAFFVFEVITIAFKRWRSN